MPVLITAGTGLIGSNVARLLATEYGEHVVLAVRRPAQAIERALLADVADRIDYAYGSVTDLGFLMRTIKQFRISYIVHSAALLPHGTSEQPLEALNVNVIGTANILEASYLMDIHRTVTLSTSAVMGDPDDLVSPLAEETIVLPPIGMYPLTKLTGEHLVQTYREIDGLDAVAIRPMKVWGPGRWHHLSNPVPHLIADVVDGKEVVRPSGADTKFNLTYVKDEARGIVQALLHEGKLPHHVYNISGGKDVLISQVVEILKEAVPEAKISIGPGLLNEVLASGRQIDKQYRSAQRPPQDISRARADFGYSPRWEIERAVPDFARWLRDGTYGEC